MSGSRKRRETSVSALRELRARKHPNYDSACFHAQQCAEKYLKAYLSKRGRTVPRTHDLVRLLDLAISDEPMWDAHRDEFAYLSSAAVDYRYPGEQADKATAKRCVEICKCIRDEVRESLGLRTKDGSE